MPTVPPAIATYIENYPISGAPAPSPSVLIDLSIWAQSVLFLSDAPQETNWRDFKRLYKKIELRIWPNIKRTRWKQEPELLPVDEREVHLLSILISRIVVAKQKQGAHTPSQTTLLYMRRRGTRLLRALSTSEVSAQRQALYVPLAFSILMESQDAIGNPASLRYIKDDTRLDLWQQRPDLALRLYTECNISQSAGCAAAAFGRGVLLAGGHEVPVLPLKELMRILKRGADYQLLWATADIPHAIDRARQDGTLSPDIWRKLGSLAESRLRKWEYYFREGKNPLAEWFVLWAELELSNDRLAKHLHYFAHPEYLDWLRERVQKAAASDIVYINLFNELTIRAIYGNPVCSQLVQEYVTTFKANLSSRKLLKLLQELKRGSKPAWTLAVAIGIEPRHFWDTWKRFLRSEAWGYWRWGWQQALNSREALTTLAHLEVTRDDWTAEIRRVIPRLLDSTQSWDRNLTTEWGCFLQHVPLSLLAALRDVESKVIGLSLPPFWVQAITARLHQDATSSAFWIELFALPPDDATWLLNLVEDERLTTLIASWPPETVLLLLERDEPQIAGSLLSWLQAHIADLDRSGPIMRRSCRHPHPEIRRLALERLRETDLDLPMALWLHESGLPEPQEMAYQFFEVEGEEWATRVLALCDSGIKATCVYGMGLLDRFPERWTSGLLLSLAHHDAPAVQAFVADQLNSVPPNALPLSTGDAIRQFDQAILNGRGRARRAKEKVKNRLRQKETELSDTSGAATEIVSQSLAIEPMREAAQTGVPRDREWALAQLVRASLDGVEVEGLKLRGAVARSSVETTKDSER